MKVDIERLRYRVNEFLSSNPIVGTNSSDAFMFSELYDALNELEESRRAITELKSPKTEFSAWLERVHPGMVKTVTLTFNTKED